MHWKHSRYQILNTIIANCHTYDEAYRVLLELEEDRSLSIELTMAESFRAKAKVLSSKLVLKEDDPEYDKLNAHASLAETNARRGVAQSCLDEARRELHFIRTLIERVKPHRMFKDYEDYEAHQLCQPLEWKLDLLWKSYSMICAVGSISYDHFINIKMHPDADKLTPVINDLLQESRTGNHNSLLNITKAQLFSRVCTPAEIFIEKPIVVELGINYGLPDAPARNEGIEFQDRGTD